MARPPSDQPTDGELEILRVLWAAGPSSLSAVCETLRAHREVATTTVATMLRILEQKSFARSTSEGRRLVYTPTVARTP